MRRGLISWSRDEVPESVLEGRVARLQRQMQGAGLDVVLVHGSVARPAAVSWLTHFVPYWGDALLAVFPSEAPVLLAALTTRMHPWIRDTSHVGELIGTRDLGKATATLINQRRSGPSGRGVSIGVVELDRLPWAFAGPILGIERAALVDAAALFAEIRQPADDAERRLATRATDIATTAIAAAPTAPASAVELVSAIDGAARLEGAEEVVVRVAPDLTPGAVLRRLESEAPLGSRYAVELSLGYKATWVRLSRCLASTLPPRSWREAWSWLTVVASRLSPAHVADGPAALVEPPATLASWTVEACIGTLPLSVVSHQGSQSPRAASSRAPSRDLPAGTLAILSVRLELEDGPWFGSTPCVIGERTPSGAE